MKYQDTIKEARIVNTIITGSINTPILVLFLIMLPNTLFAQDNSAYYLNNTFDKYVGYLINSGKIELDHHLNQPFTAMQLSKAIISDSLWKDNYWAVKLNSDLQRYLPPQTKKGSLILGVNGGAAVQQEEDEADGNCNLSLSGSYNYQNILAYYAYTGNTEYLDDSKYFGSTGKLQNRVTGRASTAYLKYNSNYFNIFYGRLDRNYGLCNTFSLIRSDNPYSYDHFSFEVFNDLLKYSFSSTRLEDKYAYDIRDSIPIHYWHKRYITFHRLEMNVSSRLKFALTESILYGGQKQTYVPAYVNPINIFFLSKMSDRNGLEEGNANVFASFEVFYKPVQKVAFYTQFLLDDMDFTKELRNKYPDRIGVSSNIAITDLLPGTQVQLSYQRISNWTYNSFYTFGNYTFYGESLGFPKNGYENLELDLSMFKFSKIFFSVGFNYLRERKQDLETHFDYKKTNFPIGISQSILGVSSEINYIPNIYLSTSLKMSYQNIANYQYLENNKKSYFNLILSVNANGVFNKLFH